MERHAGADGGSIVEVAAGIKVLFGTSMVAVVEKQR